MRNMKSILAMIMVSTLLVGCANNGYGEKQTGGMLLGGALGGLLGSTMGGGKGKLVTTAAGAVLGLIIGGEIGKSLDRADRLSIHNTTQSALERSPNGRSTVWRNPNTRVRTVVTPVRTYRHHGRYCREYTQDITVHGKTVPAYGKACRQPDGSWQIVNEQSFYDSGYSQSNVVINGHGRTHNGYNARHRWERGNHYGGR